MSTYEEAVNAQAIVWSDEQYSLAEIVEKFEHNLPQLVRVYQGIYGSESFSTGDVFKVQGIRRERKILASVGLQNIQITIPFSFRGTLRVLSDQRNSSIPRNNEYRVDELLEAFTLPVKAKFIEYDRRTAEMLSDLGGAEQIFTFERELTETYVIASTKVENVRHMCVMTVNLEIEFEIVTDDESDASDYQLIVETFLPKIEVGKMIDVPYLEYYERPTVYEPKKDDLYWNAEVDAYFNTAPVAKPRKRTPLPTVAPKVDRKTKPKQELHLENTYVIREELSYGHDPDFEEIPEEIRIRRQQKIAEMTAKETDTSTTVAVVTPTPRPKSIVGRFLPQRKERHHPGKHQHKHQQKQEQQQQQPDIYANGDDIKRSQLDISQMSVNDVAAFLRNEVHVDESVVKIFVENEIDGALLLDLNEDILRQQFDIAHFAALKIIKSARGWRPKVK
ncbi:uncharacterized protein LOC102805651 [Saccoglossus kowalevskii]|uniref:Uncharacterized protein LOC102805651 n=1 Tax=Saccoglossus kowalevskii TaxID=10224 RepID=A0ABM0M963_SACKO|nr:PREDICTED: uncharacterized protein LOC102805651 [Saccoglossus kowalevskii]